MIPDVTALLILLGLVPGWIFWTLRSSHVPRSVRSGLAEVLELVAVGVLTTGLALGLWVLVDSGHFSFVLSASEWARVGDKYVREHLTQAVVTLALVVGISCGLGFLLSKLVYRGKGEHDANGFVWWTAFATRPKGTFSYVGVMLDDGCLVEGFLMSFTSDGSEAARDVALAAPIRVTAHGSVAVDQTVSRVVIPERVIRYITVRHVDPASSSDGDGS